MKEERRFEIQEFAQFMTDKIDRLEGRFKGMHFVVNGIANEIRNSDPAMAERISDFIANAVLEEDVSEDAKEIVQMYVAVLTHGQSRDPSGLQ